jgi:DNA repair exonuclease SbcCD ATPase subunit
MVSTGNRKPGRPKETEAAEQIVPDFPTSTPRDALHFAEEERNNKQIAAARNLAVIDKKYGNGEPYNLDRLIVETRTHLSTSHESYRLAGRNLKLIKEHEEQENGPGHFHKALERIGVEPRRAQEMILVAERFDDRPTLASLGTTKLLLMATLQEEVLDELEKGGTVGEVSKDDLEKMTSREAKAAARKLRQELKDQAKVHEDLLADKNRMLDEQDRLFRERERRVKTWSGLVEEINKNLVTMSGAAIMNINHLRAQIEQIQEESRKFDLSKQEMEAIVKPFADHISNLKGYLQELEHDFGLNLSVYMPDFGGDFIEHSED